MTSPIATLPGFPFFYAIPIDGQIREIEPPRVSTAPKWAEQLGGFPDDNSLNLLQPPPYSQSSPPRLRRSSSCQLPNVRERDETSDMIPPHYLTNIAPDEDFITPARSRAKTEPITKNKIQRRKIRYPSLLVERFTQLSRKDESKDVDDNDKTANQTSGSIHKLKLRFNSISRRPTWSSFRPSTSSSIPVSSMTTPSSISIDVPRSFQMPPELEAIEVVSPTSPLNELDSSPVNELHSEHSTPQSTPRLPEIQFSPLPELNFTCAFPEEVEAPPTPPLPQRSPYRSWYIEDDDDVEINSTKPAGNPSLPPLNEEDSPPPHSEDSSVPPSTPSLDSDTGSEDSSNRSSQLSHGFPQDIKDPKDFEGDIKENVPDLSSLAARPRSVLLMTEEEVAQAEIIEDIFLMLHDLQPNYLHPAHRPQPNIIRASLIKQYAAQIEHAEKLKSQSPEGGKECPRDTAKSRCSFCKITQKSMVNWSHPA